MDNETQPVEGLQPAAPAPQTEFIAPVDGAPLMNFKPAAPEPDLLCQFDKDEPFVLATAQGGEMSFTIRKGQELIFTAANGKTMRVFIQ